MENKERVIEVETEKEIKTEEELGYFGKIAAMGVGGAVGMLAQKSTYALGIGAGLLFGKKAGLKTVGALVGIGALYTAAKQAMGEFDDDEDE